MDKNQLIQKETDNFLYYAELLAKRGYICNQLGNIAIRTQIKMNGDELILTKQRGLSIEEMTSEHIIGVGLEANQLLLGKTPPSIGHALNREILIHRKDINAVIHVHVDELIAYFSMFYDKKFQFISADAALILGSPPVIFPPELNVEVDAGYAEQYIQNTNVLILANHGITTFGNTLSQAYHRLNTMVAETRRLLFAKQLSSYSALPVSYISHNEEQKLYELSMEIL